MKKNMIEKYYFHPQPKVIMSQNAARDIYHAVMGYEAGAIESETYVDKAEAGEWLAKNFLKDEEAKKYLSSHSLENPIYLRYQVFYDAIKKKVNELLKLK